MARTIGTKWIKHIHRLVDELEKQGLSGVYELTQQVKAHLPESVWDIWEMADSEIDRVVNDYVMRQHGTPFGNPKKRIEMAGAFRGNPVRRRKLQRKYKTIRRPVVYASGITRRKGREFKELFGYPMGNPAQMLEYIVTLKHDKGKVRIKTVARTATQAVKQVCMAEGAPERAVVSVEPVRVIKLGGRKIFISEENPMHKQQYTLIAQTLINIFNSGQFIAKQEKLILEEFEEMLANDNPNFNKNKFEDYIAKKLVG